MRIDKSFLGELLQHWFWKTSEILIWTPCNKTSKIDEFKSVLANWKKKVEITNKNELWFAYKNGVIFSKICSAISFNDFFYVKKLINCSSSVK
jgi:hypothetical protein